MAQLITGYVLHSIHFKGKAFIISALTGIIIIIIMAFFLSRYSSNSNSTKTTVLSGQKTEGAVVERVSKQDFSGKTLGYENIEQTDLNNNHFYTIQSGDTLSHIAKKYYDNANSYSALAEENNIVNPHLIYPEQTIRIPNLGDSFELENN